MSYYKLFSLSKILINSAKCLFLTYFNSAASEVCSALTWFLNLGSRAGRLKKNAGA